MTSVNDLSRYKTSKPDSNPTFVNDPSQFKASTPPRHPSSQAEDGETDSAPVPNHIESTHKKGFFYFIFNVIGIAYVALVAGIDGLVRLAAFIVVCILVPLMIYIYIFSEKAVEMRREEREAKAAAAAAAAKEEIEKVTGDQDAPVFSFDFSWTSHDGSEKNVNLEWRKKA